MMTRIYGNINFECDGCGHVLDTETRDFDEALVTLRQEERESHKNGDEWKHYCSSCCEP